MYLSRIQAKRLRKARTNLISHQPSNVSLMKDIACIHSDTPSKSPSPLSVYARADSQAFDIFPLSLSLSLSLAYSFVLNAHCHSIFSLGLHSA